MLILAHQIERALVALKSKPKKIAMFLPPSLPAGGSVFEWGADTAFEAFAFCDGTVKRGVGAFGHVQLDAIGLERGHRTGLITFKTFDSTLVEFEGLLDALRNAVDARVSALWVGTDSFQVIEHILKRSLRYDSQIAQLDVLRLKFRRLKVQAISRTKNKRADALARSSLAYLR